MTVSQLRELERAAEEIEGIMKVVKPAVSATVEITVMATPSTEEED